MNQLTRHLKQKYLNGGTVLVLMGAQWLYLWVIPWYQSYVNNPQWGHNYVEAIAFLTLGLAYFNRRIISDILAFVATLLIIPASLELLPHFLTAVVSAAILILTILDICIERKRSQDIWQPSNRQLTLWFKKHMPRFSYIMLVHIALVYFFVRLPSGTYETDLVTKVFDGMLFPFILLLLLEDMPMIRDIVRAKFFTFFWGMLTMIVSLAILSNQSETWPTLALTILVTVLGVVVLLVDRKSAE